MRTVAEFVINLYLASVLAGCAAFGMLWFGLMDRTLHRHRGMHWATAERPSWTVVAQAHELVDLPPPDEHTDRLVVPKAYQSLAGLSAYTRALRHVRLRSARYTERG